MPKKSRDILKGYFKQGKRPTAENFSDLIDSMVHQDEFVHRGELDQFETAERRKFETLEKKWKEKLKELDEVTKEWNEEVVRIKALCPPPDIEIIKVPANCKPQVLKKELQGCHAFEIIAQVNAPKCKYAIMHAVAVTSSKKSEAQIQQLPVNKLTTSPEIELKWVSKNVTPSASSPCKEAWELSIKTDSDYGKDAGGKQIEIHCLIRTLAHTGATA